MVISAFDVANYFLSLVEEETGDGISNLKLQKLLYYAQGFTLAITNQPLFSEKIEAWQHGPVIPDIYHQYCKYGSNNIDIPEGIDLSIITGNDEIKTILDEINDVYGQFSAWKLRNMTHEERPWIETKLNNEIKHNLMREFFITLVE